MVIKVRELRGRRRPALAPHRRARGVPRASPFGFATPRYRLHPARPQPHSPRHVCFPATDVTCLCCRAARRMAFTSTVSALPWERTSADSMTLQPWSSQGSDLAWSGVPWGSMGQHPHGCHMDGAWCSRQMATRRSGARHACPTDVSRCADMSCMACATQVRLTVVDQPKHGERGL